jgi:membrane-associated phospholipid phosphatase
MKPRQRRARGPSLEVLEDRRLPSGFAALVRPDLVAAEAPTLSLHWDDSVDPASDGMTTRAAGEFAGRAEPECRVGLDLDDDGSIDRMLEVGPRGRFRGRVALPFGESVVRVIAEDPEGGRVSGTLSITRCDEVLDWNATLLEVIRESRTPPPIAARAMAMVHIAADDAVQDVLRSPNRDRLSRPALDRATRAAASSAAHRVLLGLFPEEAERFAGEFKGSPAGADRTRASVWGRAVGRREAAEMLADRADDGSNESSDYTPTGAIGDWRPTPIRFAQALLPHWPGVDPFALETGASFRPAGPPDLASATYAASFAEVRSLGAATGSTRTAEQTEIALFWADGAGTETPPGHWTRIAAEVSLARGLTLVENARLFAVLGAALADAGIAAWDAKYAADLWRPITAIREAEADGNPDTQADPTWSPLIATPPFPSYVSGHSTFSGAAAVVLGEIFAAGTPFSTTSEGLPGVLRSFSNFDAAAREAGVSRIYGGIHFDFDNVDGLALGRIVGSIALDARLGDHGDPPPPPGA